MVIQFDNYRKALVASVAFHLLLIFMLAFESTNTRPVMTPATQLTATQQPSVNAEPQEQAIKAVSVDNHEVLETINRLKEERLQQQRAEELRQQRLADEAAKAKKQRLAEQKRLEKLKEETAKIALAREKKLAEEKQRLKELAEQKKEQEKHLAEMKKQQQQEAARLAELQQKKNTELARIKQANEAKAKEALEEKRRAEAQQAAITAEKNAQIAGVVDKYKALIINAISRQWILPENVNNSLSSQFRIRLAPNGAVLEVHLTRSSGDPILDRSAQSAIYKASPLPVPNDPETFNLFRDISLTVRPENVRG